MGVQKKNPKKGPKISKGQLQFFELSASTPMQTICWRENGSSADVDLLRIVVLTVEASRDWKLLSAVRVAVGVGRCAASQIEC